MWVIISFVGGAVIGSLLTVFVIAVIDSAKERNLEEEDNYND